VYGSLTLPVRDVGAAQAKSAGQSRPSTSRPNSAPPRPRTRSLACGILPLALLPAVAATAHSRR
jgi:hypothetical protein